MILSHGIVFDMENNIHLDKEDFGLIYFNENIMEKKPLRTDDLITSKFILEINYFQKIYDFIYEYVEYYEENYKLDFYNLNDDKHLSQYNKSLYYTYISQNEIIKTYVNKFRFNMINFKENILKDKENDINLKEIYSTLCENEFKYFGKFHYSLILSTNLCVYALYFCMYNEETHQIQSTLDNMTSLKLINKKLFFNLHGCKLSTVKMLL
jgi:hypothetical protein